MQGKSTGFNKCSETYNIPKARFEVLRQDSGSRLKGRLSTLPPDAGNEIVLKLVLETHRLQKSYVGNRIFPNMHLTEIPKWLAKNCITALRSVIKTCHYDNQKVLL
jgi:hypothetical protein